MPETEIRHFQCRHIFTDGHRCGSKCLRDQDFCFYHHSARKPKPIPDLYRDSQSSFELPAPEDRSAIQAGIGLVLQRIASGCLDSKRAGLILYGLQIASLNLPRATPSSEESVVEVTLDDHNQALAPIKEILPEKAKQTLEELVMEQWYMTASAEPEPHQTVNPCAAPFVAPQTLAMQANPASRSSRPRKGTRSRITLQPGHVLRKGTRSRVPPQFSCKSPLLSGGLAASSLVPRRRTSSLSLSPAGFGAAKLAADTSVPLRGTSAPPALIIPTLHATHSGPKRRKAHSEEWAFPDICRRSPNLPHTYACSTIGPARLNFRVRDGNGCDPRGKLTGKLENFALAIFHN